MHDKPHPHHDVTCARDPHTAHPTPCIQGHMAKATRQMKERMKQCDLVVEVRDARVPLSSINGTLEALVNNKLKAIVYNKADLADPAAMRRVAEMNAEKGRHSIFISATQNQSTRELVDFLRGQTTTKFKTAGLLAMICGMPNVGKSTIINTLAAHKSGKKARKRGRHGAASSARNAKHLAAVGARPGVTRTLSSIVVSTSPVIRIVDSPGIMVPKIQDVETGLKLTLTGAIKDELVGYDTLVDYLLHVVRTRGLAEDRFWEGLRVPVERRPPDLSQVNSEGLVELVERPSGAFGKSGDQREDMAFRYILGKFRDGSLGRATLDDVGLELGLSGGIGKEGEVGVEGCRR